MNRKALHDDVYHVQAMAEVARPGRVYDCRVFNNNKSGGVGAPYFERRANMRLGSVGIGGANWIHMFLYIYMCIYKSIHKCIYIYMYIYIYTYIHTYI